jgi:hypothetical protein
MGTSFADIPTLLAQYHVDAVITNKAHAAKDGLVPGMKGLEQQLGAGHKVIVSVNAELIWHQPVETKYENGNPRGDHAVVVTGVDTADNVAHLNDIGTPEGRDEQIQRRADGRHHHSKTQQRMGERTRHGRVVGKTPAKVRPN